MTMTILLIRHGETPLNAARVVQPADTPLSARGVDQALALARRLVDLRVTAILSSDLPRALQTAQTIAAATDVGIDTSTELHERNFGDWRGLAHDALPGIGLRTTDAPPGGESVADFEARVARAFALIVQRAAARPGVLAVVSHGLVIRAMLARHIGLPSGTTAPDHIGNTALNVFDARAPHLASLVNCTRHLDDAIRDESRALS